MASERRVYRHSAQEVFRSAALAFRESGWLIKEEDPKEGEIAATTGTTLRSWGETITCEISTLPDGQCAVVVESKAGAQLVTWGKSGENVARFFDLLENHLLR